MFIYKWWINTIHNLTFLKDWVQHYMSCYPIVLRDTAASAASLRSCLICIIPPKTVILFEPVWLFFLMWFFFHFSSRLSVDNRFLLGGRTGKGTPDLFFSLCYWLRTQITEVLRIIFTRFWKRDWKILLKAKLLRFSGLLTIFSLSCFFLALLCCQIQDFQIIKRPLYFFHCSDTGNLQSFPQTSYC